MTTEASVAAAEPPVSDAVPRRAWVWAGLALGLATVALLILFRAPVQGMLAVWASSPSFEHGFLVVLVALAASAARWRLLAEAVPRPCYWGLAMVVPAALLAAAGLLMSTMVVQQLAMIALFQGLVLTVLGREPTKVLAFPLGYLYFAIPVGDALVPPLRDATAALSVEVLSLMGVTATLDGFMIRLPSADYRVDEACAGLRFFLVGVATSVLAANLFLRSWSRRLALLVLALVVPILGNALRAVLLIWLAERGLLEPGSLFEHLTYGLTFSAFMIVALFLLAFAMRQEPAVVDAASAGAGGRMRLGRHGGLLAFLAAAVVALIPPAVALALAGGSAPSSRLAIALRAPDVPGWTRLSSTDARWRPSAAPADAELRAVYGNGDARVDLYIAAYATQRQGAEVVSDRHRLIEFDNWREDARHAGAVTIDSASLSLDQVVVHSHGKRRLVWKLYWVDGRLTAGRLSAKLYQAKVALLGGTEAAAVIVAATPQAESLESAQATMQAFFAQFGAFRKVLAGEAAADRKQSR